MAAAAAAAAAAALGDGLALPSGVGIGGGGGGTHNKVVDFSTFLAPAAITWALERCKTIFPSFPAIYNVMHGSKWSSSWGKFAM